MTFAPKVTKKGTSLPVLNLKGKPYLQVAHRLVWFEEENPCYHMSNDYLKLTDTEAVIKCTIIVLDDKGQAVRKVCATKKETTKDFPDNIEKAETGALGRALAMLGYGTQFAPDMDEGNRLADAPVPVAVRVTAEVGPTASGGTAAPVVTSVTNPIPIERPSFRKKKPETPDKKDLF